MCDVLQECNPVVKQDLPIIHLLLLLLTTYDAHTHTHMDTHTPAQLHISQEYANIQQ